MTSIASAVKLNPVDAEGLELAKDSQQRYLVVGVNVDADVRVVHFDYWV